MASLTLEESSVGLTSASTCTCTSSTFLHVLQEVLHFFFERFLLTFVCNHHVCRSDNASKAHAEFSPIPFQEGLPLCRIVASFAFEKSPEQIAYEQALNAWQNAVMMLVEKGGDPKSLGPQPIPEQFGYAPANNSPKPPTDTPTTARPQTAPTPGAQ